MHKETNAKCVIKATIRDIIVAFLYVSIVVGVIYGLFSEKISEAISLVDMVSIRTNEKVLENVKIDLEKKTLINYPEYGTKYGTIKIPSLNIDLPLYYGDSLSVIKYGVGQSSGSYFPGEGGTVLCVGHNFKRDVKNASFNQKGRKYYDRNNLW